MVSDFNPSVVSYNPPTHPILNIYIAESWKLYFGFKHFVLNTFQNLNQLEK